MQSVGHLHISPGASERNLHMPDSGTRSINSNDEIERGQDYNLFKSCDKIYEIRRNVFECPCISRQSKIAARPTTAETIRGRAGRNPTRSNPREISPNSRSHVGLGP